MGESGNVQHAADDFDALLADCMQVMGPDHQETLSVRNNYLLYGSADMDADEAANAWMDLIDDSARILGQLAPATLSSMHNLARGLPSLPPRSRRRMAADRARRADDVLRAEHPHTLATGAVLPERDPR